MGSGKSRVGAELAKLMELPFIDSDREIEQAANCTIAEIFEKYGEQEFRKGERQVMQRLLLGEAKILASGGGAFIQPEIRKTVKEKALSVWLKADLQTLVERVSRTSHRPLLREVDPAQRLQQLMDERYPVYAEADITVPIEQRTPRETALQVKAAIDRFRLA